MAAKMTATEIAIRLKAVERDVDEHDKILIRGNGEPSLQENMRTVLKYIEKEDESRKFYSRLLVGAVLTNLVSLALATFIWFVRIYPVLERLTTPVAVK